MKRQCLHTITGLRNLQNVSSSINCDHPVINKILNTISGLKDYQDFETFKKSCLSCNQKNLVQTIKELAI